MNLLTCPAAFCRAIWTEPSRGETGAPARRIIHARGLRCSGPVRLHRLGLRLGQGYFKCGSVQETDWIADLRVRVFDGRAWKTALELIDQPRPEASATLWTDLGGIDSAAVLIELRRAGVDGWWPSWNLANSAVVLEGEAGDGGPAPSIDNLRLEACDLSGLPAGVRAQRLGGEVRFATRWYEVGFRLGRAGFAYLALDDEGQGRTSHNLLRSANLASLGGAGREYMVQGLRLSPVGQAEVISALQHRAQGTTRIEGNTVTYEVHAPSAGQTYRLRWEMLEDRLRLSAERHGAQPLRAWDSSAWQIACNSQVTPTATLGRITRCGEAGMLELPVCLHAPAMGSLRIAGTGAAQWRCDSMRPWLTTTNELKLGEIPQPEGDYLLPAGVHRCQLEWLVETPRLAEVADGAPASVARALRRCAVTGLTYRADTATFSNNGNSMHAVICMDSWSALATRLGALSPGFPATQLLRDTLEGWLDGRPGYASGWSSHGKYLYEDEYLMSGTGALLGLAEFLQHNGDAAWLSERAESVERELQRMRGRDLDGDGLIESPYRLGNSGQHQWSTCWYDVISFGWKDAFSNALLYAALRMLAGSLPRLGQPKLAEGLEAWAGRLRSSYRECFFNPQTGWFAGWRSKDGALHDYGFLFVNGAAVNAGLVEGDEARAIMEKLWEELLASGLADFRLGLPGNLRPIPDSDMAAPQHHMPLGFYQNAGLTHSQARHFVGALYRVGMKAEADRLLEELCASLADASAFGGVGSGVDWRLWDGTPSGYEGLLSDQFGILATALERFGRRTDVPTGNKA